MSVSAKRTTVVICGMALLSLALTSRSGATVAATTADPVTISLLAGGNDPAALKFATDLANKFMAANPTIKVKVETRPGGTDGDNLVKTRLATKTMNDVFLYNSGSLFQALNPVSQLVVQCAQPWA